MPRRWKDAFHVGPDENIEDYFTVVGNAGITIAEHCGATLTQLTLLSNAIRTTCYPAPEPLDDAVKAAAQNLGTGPWPASVREFLNNFGMVTNELAAEIGRVKTNDWKKAASSGGRSLTVMEISQGASRVAAERLRAVELLVRELV